MVIVAKGIYEFYNVYKYEQQKNEWNLYLSENEKYFDYITDTLNSNVLLKDCDGIALSDSNKVIGLDQVAYLHYITNDSYLIEAVNKVKDCNVDLILRYDSTGWSFIRQIYLTNGVGAHETGIYSTENGNKDSINHIYQNWYFRDTRYNLNKIQRYYKLFNMFVK